MHTHEHHHHHDHHFHTLPASVNRAFIIGIVLNILFVIIEAVYGFHDNSLALLSDAGHNLSDVVSLALGLLGFRLAKIKATKNFTYGFQKTTVLVALVNAVLLLIAIGGICIEATHRLIDAPRELKGNVIANVAGVGIVINGISAFLFFKDKEHDVNVKGAYLHLAADALVSIGVVISGIIIKYTTWYWLDSAVSYLIAVVIFIATWGLLKDSLRMTLDAVPRDLDINEVKEKILNIPGVKDVHHIHIWAMSTTQNALTAHVVLDNNVNPHIAKKKIKHELEHLEINHATLETESVNENCGEHGEC